VLPPAGLSRAEIDTAIYRAKGLINSVLLSFGGSISAEHGIGRLKKPDFISGLSDPQARLLGAIKRAIDPQIIMNPGCQLNFAKDS
jgi:FAD/FMN-containing dehydrogenase